MSMNSQVNIMNMVWIQRIPLEGRETLEPMNMHVPMYRSTEIAEATKHNEPRRDSSVI